MVAPATPADAKGLLLAAFEDGNPVLFLEHKLLYRSTRGPVQEGWRRCRSEAGTSRAPERDATIVTYGVGVPWALEAASALADEGHEIEVDRSAQPVAVGRRSRA